MSPSLGPPYPPLTAYPYSEPHATEPAARMVWYKNGHVNMKATFAGMSKGQTILIYVDLKRDLSRIKSSAASAEVRIRIDLRPLINAEPGLVAILVTFLGPSRKGRKTYSPPDSEPRARCFGAIWKTKPAAATQKTIDIFS